MSFRIRIARLLSRAAGVAVIAAFGSVTTIAAAQHTVTVNSAAKFQTIEGWGTSLAAWTGANYTDPNFRAAYRDAGCNILRVDMGQRVIDPNCGGTAVNFTGNVASDAALLNFNHSRTVPYWQMAQWLAANALEPARVKIEGSVWTPPHWMKGKTGCSGGRPMPRCATFGGDSVGGRLVQTDAAGAQANRDQFARYFAAWLYKWKQTAGVPISYASIQNELSYENPFDSCTYQKAPGCVDAYWQWGRALRAVYDRMAANGQTAETKLMGPHEAGIGETDSNPFQLLFQTNHVQALIDRDAALWNLLPVVNNNGYVSESKEAARCWDAQVRGIDNVPGAWPTTWGFAPIMHTGMGTGKMYWASEADGVQPANAMAYSVRMHNALVHGRVSAYVSWQMSATDPAENEHELLGTSNWATPHRSLKYCNFKHFARYIRPGAQRVAATFGNGEATVLGADRWDANSGLSVSAYNHSTDGRTTVVLINRTASSQSVTINGLSGTSYQAFRTTGTDTIGFNQLPNFPVSGGSVSLSVPAGSVTTLTTP